MTNTKVIITNMYITSMLALAITLNTQVLQFMANTDVTVVFTCQTLEWFIGCLENSSFSVCYADTQDDCRYHTSTPTTMLVNKTHHLANSSLHGRLGQTFFRNCTATRKPCNASIVCQGAPSLPESCITFRGLGACDSYTLPSVSIHTSLKYKVIEANLLTITDCRGSNLTKTTPATFQAFNTTSEKSTDDFFNFKTTYIAVGVTVGSFVLIAIILVILLSRRYFKNKHDNKSAPKATFQHKSGTSSDNICIDDTVKQDESYCNIDEISEGKGLSDSKLSPCMSSLICDLPNVGNSVSSNVAVDICTNDNVYTNVESMPVAINQSIHKAQENKYSSTTSDGTTMMTYKQDNVYDEYGDHKSTQTNPEIVQKIPDVISANAYSKLGEVERVKLNPYNVNYNTNVYSLAKDYSDVNLND